MKFFSLALFALLVSTTAVSQNNSDLKKRINESVNNQAKASKYEYNMYSSLFKYEDYLAVLEKNRTTIESEEKRKISSLSRTSSDAIKSYKKQHESLDLTTKMVRKKHYDIFVVEAESLLDRLDKKAESQGNTSNDVFAKKVSAFMHKYDALINYNPRAYLANTSLSSLTDYSKDRDNLKANYEELRGIINDEFKMADEQGIIDSYSKKKKYSEVFDQINGLDKNEALKDNLKKGVINYVNHINTFFDQYSKLLPEFFIKWEEYAKKNHDFYTSLGFTLSESESNNYQKAITKLKTLKPYIDSKEHQTYATTKNKNLFDYTYVDETNGEVTFKRFTHQKEEAASGLISTLMRERNVFKENYDNYKISKVVAISKKDGKNYVGVWKDKESGVVVDKAYSYRQDFIITYKDISSGICYAVNAKVKFIEDHYFIDPEDMKLTHQRMVDCK